MSPLKPDAKLVRAVPIFASLSDEQIQDIVSAPDNEIVEFPALAQIIEEDEIGSCMFIILEGLVDVRIKAVGGREITIATLKEGEFFGEQALLPGASGRRNASVKSIRDCRLFKITKKDVALGLADNEELPKTPIESDDVSQAERAKMLVRSVRLFRALSEKDLDNIGDWAEIVEFESGEMILREGEEGDFMYIVLDGSVEVFVADEDGKIVILAELVKGNYFGEQALLPEGCGKRNANVRANHKATLIRVAKKYFQLIVNHDNRLMLALKAVGDSQNEKIINAIGRPFNN
ncbi:MAG: cyclic nucleotide-binding domain-containing protein [Gammaproteobacteria bacterium]